SMPRLGEPSRFSDQEREPLGPPRSIGAFEGPHEDEPSMTAATEERSVRYVRIAFRFLSVERLVPKSGAASVVARAGAWMSSRVAIEYRLRHEQRLAANPSMSQDRPGSGVSSSPVDVE